MRWLVQFIEPPVAARFAGAPEIAAEGRREERMRAYAEALREQRQPTLQAIRSLGVVVISTTEYTANAAVIEGPAAGAHALLDALRKLPGVSSVQRMGVYRAGPNMPPAAPPGR